MYYRAILIVVWAVMLSGCLAGTTQQNVGDLARVGPGMSEEEVVHIMGLPVSTEFSGDRKALHYCKTGYTADSFAVVILEAGKVVAARNYGVSVQDAGGAGDCSMFIRNIDFRES